MSVNIPVSWGELIDKITILEIKLNEIKSPDALKNVRQELDALTQVAGPISDETQPLKTQLLEINRQLWAIEDDIRDCERRSDFGDEFIRLARAVYVTNDKRAAIKREINMVLKSDLVEEKSYQDY